MKHRKNNVIKCSPDFYDYYTIPFPIKAMGRIQKNKYLCSQLEKLHPCFSDDCCFDSRIKFSGHGLQADVVVMQKFRLAEYKSQNHHKPIYIEELKKIPFFKDYKIKSGVVILAGVLAFAVFFTGIIIKYRQKQQSLQTTQASASLDFSESNVPALETDGFLQIKTFFETLSLNDGKVTDFSWKLNGFTQDYSIVLKNIFPEQLLNTMPQVAFSSVAYDNNVPLMSAQFKGALQSSDFLANETVAVNELTAAFRGFLFQKKMNIIEETVNPCGIKARLLNDESSLTSLLEYFVEENLPLSMLAINVSKEGILIYAGISNTPIKNQKSFYECLLKNVQVFFIQENPAENFDLKKSPQKAVAKAPHINKKEIVIGKIFRIDGSALEFYKDEEGKIKQREGGMDEE